MPTVEIELAAAALLLSACGRGRNQSADSAAPADSTALAFRSSASVCRISIATERIAPHGFAVPDPAMSGALP